MSDLAAFMNARLDEDAASAEARQGIFPSPGVEDSGAVWLHVKRGGNAVVVHYAHPVEGYGDMADLQAWADTDQGWTKDRVLREVEAKRRRLRRWVEHDRLAAERRAEGRPSTATENIRDACWVNVLDDASVYSDHPEYDKGWKP